MPKMVMVDVDGVRMWYPSALIVVQASDDLLLRFGRMLFFCIYVVDITPTESS